MKQGWSAFMERRVKERLVGATILVALVVLIVPALLSGPKHQAPTRTSAGETRNYTVDLATDKALPTESNAPGSASPAAGDAPSADSVATPASAAAHAPSTAAAPTITTLQAQPSAANVENAAPLLKSAVEAKQPASHEGIEASHHYWAIQLGLFASHDNAEKFEHSLRAQGYSAYLVAGGSGKKAHFKVRVGPLVDHAAADKMLVRLHKDGHAGTVVAP